jgi:hypothetical protein
LPNGGVQYLIQIRPSLIQALEAGQPVESDIPPQIQREIRSYRITVGSKTLPQDPPLGSFGSSNSSSNSNIPSVVPNPMRSPAGPTGYSSPGRSIVPGPSAWPLMSSPPTVPSNPASQPSWPAGAAGAKLAEKPSLLTEPSSGSSANAVASGVATDESKPPTSSTVPEKRWSWGMYLVIAMVALACSVSWNVYLLVLLKEARRRYRNLLQRSGLTQDELDEEEGADQV